MSHIRRPLSRTAAGVRTRLMPIITSFKGICHGRYAIMLSGRSANPAPAKRRRPQPEDMEVCGRTHGTPWQCQTCLAVWATTKAPDQHGQHERNAAGQYQQNMTWLRELRRFYAQGASGSDSLRGRTRFLNFRDWGLTVEADRQRHVGGRRMVCQNGALVVE